MSDLLGWAVGESNAWLGKPGVEKTRGREFVHKSVGIETFVRSPHLHACVFICVSMYLVLLKHEEYCRSLNKAGWTALLGFSNGRRGSRHSKRESAGLN